MRPRLAVLLPLLLIGGCGIFGPAGKTPQQECEYQANNDPKVVDLEIQRFSLTPADRDISPDIAVARRQALLRCLAARGVIPPPGVEPVRPRF